MLRAPGAIWMAFRGYYNQPGLMTVVNGTTILYSLPLVIIAIVPPAVTGHLAYAPLALALLVGVMPNPAAAGLHFCAREVARNDEVAASDVRQALRDYWKPAAALYAFSLVSFAIIVINIVFYTSLDSPAFFVLDLIWLYLFFTWFGAQMYLYPMLFTVEKISVPLIYRNAIVMAFRKPISSLTLLIVWLAILVFSSATGLILVLGLIIAAIMQHALVLRLLSTMTVGQNVRATPASNPRRKSGNRRQA